MKQSKRRSRKEARSRLLQTGSMERQAAANQKSPGDCNRNRGSHSSGTDSSNTSVGQSPRTTDTAGRQEDKLLRSGVGYITIFQSGKEKFELSNKGSTMRFTLGEREYLFSQVEDQSIINEIDERSENWFPRGINRRYGYIIMEQRNAANKPTGYFKIIKRLEAIVERVSSQVVPEKDSSAWTYYERLRKVQEHEI